MVAIALSTDVSRVYILGKEFVEIQSVYRQGGSVNRCISAVPVSRRDRPSGRATENAGCAKKPLRMAETLDKFAHPRTVEFAFNAARL